MNDYLLSVLLGVVEGLTEFLPVSSTAHLRLTQALLGVDLHSGYWKMFAVVIQLPAILAVVIYFRQRIVDFVKSFFAGPMTFKKLLTHPVTLVLVATVVTGVPAKVLKKVIKGNLESLYVIGGALVIGGVVMWVIDVIYGVREKRLLAADEAAGTGQTHATGTESLGTTAGGVTGGTTVVDYATPVADSTLPNTTGLTRKVEEMKLWQAVWIGAVQILSAVFPGTSRSMSTIAAGQVAGLTRVAALEFSFFLSIPIMFAACIFDLKDSLKAPINDPDYVGVMTSQKWAMIGLGSAVSFLVALAVIAWFMTWVRRRGFVPFAVYRVVLGVIVLLVAAGAIGNRSAKPTPVSAVVVNR